VVIALSALVERLLSMQVMLLLVWVAPFSYAAEPAPIILPVPFLFNPVIMLALVIPVLLIL
jgi:hypothetical protein